MAVREALTRQRWNVLNIGSINLPFQRICSEQLLKSDEHCPCEALFMTRYRTKNLVSVALCIALGVLLPMFFHMIGLGPTFLPMHIPVTVRICMWLAVRPCLRAHCAIAFGIVHRYASHLSYCDHHDVRAGCLWLSKWLTV